MSSLKIRKGRLPRPQVKARSSKRMNSQSSFQIQRCKLNKKRRKTSSQAYRLR